MKEIKIFIVLGVAVTSKQVENFNYEFLSLLISKKILKLFTSRTKNKQSEWKIINQNNHPKN